MILSVADRHGAGPSTLGTELLGVRRSAQGVVGGRQHLCDGPAHHLPGRVPDELLSGVRPPDHRPLGIDHRYRRVGHLPEAHRLGESRLVGVRHLDHPIGVPGAESTGPGAAGATSFISDEIVRYDSIIVNPTEG